MGYINKITIGGESYSLAPEVADSSIYAEDNSGNTLIAYPLTVNDAGQIGLNLAAGSTIYALKDLSGKFCYGLGIDASGALGLALYHSGRATTDSATIAPLAIYQGRIGVYAHHVQAGMSGNILRTDISGALFAGVDWYMSPASIIGDSGSKIAEIHLGVSNQGLYLYTITL